MKRRITAIVLIFCLFIGMISHCGTLVHAKETTSDVSAQNVAGTEVETTSQMAETETSESVTSKPTVNPTTDALNETEQETTESPYEALVIDSNYKFTLKSEWSMIHATASLSLTDRLWNMMQTAT